MKFLFRLMCLLYVAMPLAGADPTVEGEARNESGRFRLAREKVSGETTLSVTVEGKETPVWVKSGRDEGDGSNSLNYWQIVDGYLEGDSVAILLSTHLDNGLVWVRASWVDGRWRTDFTQEVYGVASREMRIKSIKFNGLDAIVVTDMDGVAATYIRDEQGQMFRNGEVFENSMPGSPMRVP